jgi:hypothetical protein
MKELTKTSTRKFGYISDDEKVILLASKELYQIMELKLRENSNLIFVVGKKPYEPGIILKSRYNSEQTLIEMGKFMEEVQNKSIEKINVEEREKELKTIKRGELK